ncbi:unnamed protein product, partial [Owenia fusiformis]
MKVRKLEGKWQKQQDGVLWEDASQLETDIFNKDGVSAVVVAKVKQIDGDWHKLNEQSGDWKKLDSKTAKKYETNGIVHFEQKKVKKVDDVWKEWDEENQQWKDAAPNNAQKYELGDFTARPITLRKRN